MGNFFGVRGPCFENEGAMHYAGGKFILSISGIEKSEEKSDRARKIVGIVVACATLIVLLITSMIVGHEANSMPYKFMLSESIGQPINIVADNLELKIDAFDQLEPGVYTINSGCELSGVPFDITLYFDDDALLCGFMYFAEYNRDANKAASDLYKLAIDFHLKSIAKTELENADFSKRGLKRQFENGIFSVHVESDRTPIYSATPSYQYLRRLEAAEDWPGRVGEYVTVSAMLYEDIDMRYSPDTEQIYVRVLYSIEPDRSK